MASTDRLRLRLLRVSDAVPLRELAPPGWVETVVMQPGDRTLTPWAIVVRDEGAVAGFCGFFVRPARGITMGYAIVPEHRGRGLATEAASAVLDWAERHDIDVYSSIRPPNPASARVLEKIDMRLVGSYRDEDGPRDTYRRCLRPGRPGSPGQFRATVIRPEDVPDDPPDRQLDLPPCRGVRS